MAQKLYEEAPIPKDERQRLASLKALRILDTPPEERFDRITKLALQLFDVPISTVTLVDSKREWFKSCQGLPVKEGKRAISFCGHTVLSNDLFMIPDATKDPRFAKNPMVQDKPYIKFYAAFPLKAADGKRVGAFCIKDRRPRRLGEGKIALLKSLATWAELELNTHELNLAITTREKAEAKIAQLNEVLKLLHKSLKHDLLNNLTVIRGYIEMYEKMGKKKLLKWVLATIDQGINHIKQVAKLEAAVAVGALKKYQTREVIEKVSTLFPLINFNIKGQAEILADEAIFSVAENIIRNAQIHGKTKRIDVVIKNNQDLVEIYVADYGQGIPNHIKKGLFKEGFKYGITGHSGLGLYIIKKTIERYGGTVSLEDNKPKGTQVIIKLPNAKTNS